MFMNAKKYNVKGSGIYTDAKKLDKLNRTTYERLMGGTGNAVPLSSAGAAAKDSDGEEDEMSPVSAQVPIIAPLPSAPVASTSSSNPSSSKRVYMPQYTSTGELINPPTPAEAKPPKKKIKLHGSTNGNEKKTDDKPPTLTKWLTAKLDDLSELTDEQWVCLAFCVDSKGAQLMQMYMVMLRSGRRLADVFVQLPPKELYPDYYQLIAKPVSLHLVRVRSQDMTSFLCHLY